MLTTSRVAAGVGAGAGVAGTVVGWRMPVSAPKMSFPCSKTESMSAGNQLPLPQAQGNGHCKQRATASGALMLTLLSGSRDWAAPEVKTAASNRAPSTIVLLMACLEVDWRDVVT